MAKNKKFQILGIVVNGKTKDGVGNLRVEAWDLDKKYHKRLGVATTNSQGRFLISIDKSYIREFALETAPVLFFKVYRGNKLIKNTKDSVLWNAEAKTELYIEVDALPVAPVGKDRVSAIQVMKGMGFVKKSDLRGLLNETGDKGNSLVGYMTDMVKNAAVNMEIKPVKPSALRTRDVVNQDVATATGRLQAQKVAVNEVRAYQPGLNARSIADLKDFPLRLAPGSKVNLYEKDGKVMYYSAVKEPKITRPSEALKTEISELEERKASLADNEAIRNEIDTLKSEKADLTKELADIRKEIATMNHERAAMQDTRALREQLTELSVMHRELSLSIAKDRPVKDVTGVSIAMDAKLRKIGIRTVGELAVAKVEKLVSGGISNAQAVKVITAANRKLQV
ncbi:MAG: hypothetical protein GY774_03920 [Planctomycetes bacterium]|nr:hypothetical protein [Planctomycetota bacterium]